MVTPIRKYLLYCTLYSLFLSQATECSPLSLLPAFRVFLKNRSLHAKRYNFFHIFSHRFHFEVGKTISFSLDRDSASTLNQFLFSLLFCCSLRLICLQLAAILSAAQTTRDVSSAPATALNSSGFNPSILNFFTLNPFCSGVRFFYLPWEDLHLLAWEAPTFTTSHNMSVEVDRPVMGQQQLRSSFVPTMRRNRLFGSASSRLNSPRRVSSRRN